MDVEENHDLGKVSLIGAGMRSHPGVAAKMFRTLADLGINLEMISTSPIKISCMIGRERDPARRTGAACCVRARPGARSPSRRRAPDELRDTYLRPLAPVDASLDLGRGVDAVEALAVRLDQVEVVLPPLVDADHEPLAVGRVAADEGVPLAALEMGHQQPQTLPPPPPPPPP